MIIYCMTLFMSVFEAEKVERIERVEQNAYNVTFEFITSLVGSNVEMDAFFKAFRCSGIIFNVKDTLDRGYVPFLKTNCYTRNEALFGLDDFFETQEEKEKNNDSWQEFKKTVQKDLNATFEISFTPLRNRNVSVAIRPIGNCSKGFYETPFLIIDIFFESDSPSKVECFEISKYGTFHPLNE